MIETITNIDEFITWTKRLKGRLLVYRGLPDVNWEVSASAYRRIKTSPGELPPPIVFQNYIKQLLDDASLRGFREQQGKSYTDLELLAELQHHGAATCLIDFTTNALVALWFACEAETDQAGKVVAMATDNFELFSTVKYDDLQNDIDEFLYKDKLWKWAPSHMSNRIVAQQSVFVLGEGLIAAIHYEAVKIDLSSKQQIGEELKERFGINEQHLFSDFTGFALSNAHDRPYSGYTIEDYLHQGIEFTQRRDFKDAINVCNRAIKLDPNNSMVFHTRGNAKCEIGDLQG